MWIILCGSLMRFTTVHSGPRRSTAVYGDSYALKLKLNERSKVFLLILDAFHHLHRHLQQASFFEMKLSLFTYFQMVLPKHQTVFRSISLLDSEEIQKTQTIQRRARRCAHRTVQKGERLISESSNSTSIMYDITCIMMASLTVWLKPVINWWSNAAGCSATPAVG